MLSDNDIAKPCHGRIVKAAVYQSSGRDAAGPHWAVILNADKEIIERDTYSVAVISNNDKLDPKYIVPVPRRTGLTGFIICSWVEMIHLPGIATVGQKLEAPEMLQVLQMVRAAAADRRRPSAQ